MANIKSAQKQMLQNRKRRVINVARQSAIKSCVKKVLVALDAGKSKEEVMQLFNEAQAKFSRAKSKGLCHAKTASRKVSRLALKVNKKFAQA